MDIWAAYVIGLPAHDPKHPNSTLRPSHFNLAIAISCFAFAHIFSFGIGLFILVSTRSRDHALHAYIRTPATIYLFCMGIVASIRIGVGIGLIYKQQEEARLFIIGALAVCGIHMVGVFIHFIVFCCLNLKHAPPSNGIIERLVEMSEIVPIRFLRRNI
ncbi:hypothetical protein DM860_008019 [Cuscuta australis]|uniref:Uncharacterized protein n=1 Tax=Cuscuta australis TaxID=267555 RepID=A0A328DX83_9ASTE|nr:hypothetical protein DM860_008019 [Cuscuta australis]